MANKRKRRPSATPPAEKPTQEQAVSNEGATDQQRMIEKEKGAIIQEESEKTDTAPPDPGKTLIRIKDKNVTVLPAEEDPAELAEAAEQLKKAQERLQATFAPAAEIIRRNQQIRKAMISPGIEEILRHNRQIQQTVSPAFELFLQTQYQRNSAIAEYGKIIAAAMRSPAMEAMQNMVITMQTNLERVTRTFQSMQDTFDASRWDSTRQMLEEIKAASSAMLSWTQEREELLPYLEEELKKPQYGGKTLEDLLNETGADSDGLPPTDSLLVLAITAACAARDARQTVIDAQNKGREQRRKAKEAAQKSGAIMDLRNGIMPIFSERGLWDAFSPNKISRMGKLSDDVMDKTTGRIYDDELESGDILPMNAAEISYKALMLLSAIKANSVENFRETFVRDGAITFYVKGVLDRIDINPRQHDDMQQITLDRKTAGALYLEKQFEPLLNLIGSTPNGSRYAVFNYYGYDVENDTMTIRTPYLFQLWIATQRAHSVRLTNRERRIADGKNPLKKDLKPLELNTLFTAGAYKEDDAVLEIAAYITNVMLNAGRGAHTTKISYRTIIKNCSRLREKLDEIEALPTKQKLENGKIRNNAARYNVELRKIAKAFKLIMNPNKCSALQFFAFDEVEPTTGKGNQRELVPPVKKTLNEEIRIKWHRIDRETD